ncbi:SDR family oxidoreductase [Patulibacter sp. NPDC049589]|uniref:SDR family NAD(P)-dependent oxidoreductase n=1 Tax=Patulibacter sp. NPDC049589 TaxID=3154731 RepID=UPI00341DD6F9
MTTAPIALITGGNRGIGRSTAIELARDGVDVIVTYRTNEAEAREVVAETEALGATGRALRLDTSVVAGFAAWTADLKDVLAGLDREGIDLLVNNAGTGLQQPFAETTEAQFDAMVDVHLKGVYFLTQGLLPLINDGASIVNVSSGLARVSHAGSSAYAVVKGGVEVLTRYLAVELGGRGITVNTVAPGAVATDFRGGAVRDTPEINAAIAAISPFGRVAVADDIGTAIAGLFASRSRWVTGQRIEASGGMAL